MTPQPLHRFHFLCLFCFKLRMIEMQPWSHAPSFETRNHRSTVHTWAHHRVLIVGERSNFSAHFIVFFATTMMSLQRVLCVVVLVLVISSRNVFIPQARLEGPAQEEQRISKESIGINFPSNNDSLALKLFQGGNLQSVPQSASDENDKDFASKSMSLSNISLDWQSQHQAEAAPPSWFFEKSKLQVSTSGSYTVSNVCIRSAAVWPTVPLFIAHGNLTLPPPILGFPHLSGFQNHNTSDWIKLDLSTFFDEEVLYLEGGVLLDSNPGHCMNDLMFSLAVDIARRKTHLLGTGSPVYSHFVYGAYGPSKKTLTPRYHPRDCRAFCCDFLTRKLELIRYPEDFIAAVQESGDDRPVCFKQLTIPRAVELRHERTAETDEALQMIQSHMFHNTTVMSKELEASPWPEIQPPLLNSSSTPSRMRILLYGREDSSRRVLTNVTRLKILLEEEYDVDIDYIDGNRWSDLLKSRTAQARLYNSHQNVLTIHGAHLTNLFYARPGTKVYEIQCWMPPTSIRAISQQWFSRWAPALGIRYKTFTEKEGCLMADGRRHQLYSPPHVSISDVPKFVRKVAGFFKLQRIGNTTAVWLRAHWCRPFWI